MANSGIPDKIVSSAVDWLPGDSLRKLTKQVSRYAPVLTIPLRVLANKVTPVPSEDWALRWPSQGCGLSEVTAIQAGSTRQGIYQHNPAEHDAQEASAYLTRQYQDSRNEIPPLLGRQLILPPFKGLLPLFSEPQAQGPDPEALSRPRSPTCPLSYFLHLPFLKTS